MNYDKLYKDFINYCKNTTPKTRLSIRDDQDIRLRKDHLYVENHHIIPKSVGGSDDIDNMILLLPEEHLFAHKIRYKAYNLRQDMLAVRFILNGLANRGHIDKTTSLRLTQHIKKQYAWIRSSSAEFRLNHGWQTESGVKRISNARKNTMPVKDAITGEMIGSVDVNHPKVISREWVHHSTGRKISKEHRLKLKSQKANKNNNYKSFATCDFLLIFLHNHKSLVVDDSFYFSKKKFNGTLKEHIKNEYEKKIHADSILKNRFGSIEEFINRYNQTYNENLIFKPYYRSTEQRLMLSKINKGKKC